jgi:RimJ/RimL family protein N-acetyltransferase
VKNIKHNMELPIKSKRLYITEFDESMAKSVHANSLDDDNRRFVPDEVFETVAQAKKTLFTLISFYSKNDAPLVYAIILNDGRQIGHVQTFPTPIGWEIGFHIAKLFTGNGYATEAVKAFLPVIMRDLGITQIYGLCHADNGASRKVLEKCGFMLEYEGMGQYHGSEQRICNYTMTNIEF